MTRTSRSPIRQGKTAERDGFFMPVLAVSIGIAIFAVVAQCLAATGAISLSVTLQLTLWLVAAGLIVLLWIAYMAVQAQARMAEAVEAATAAAEREAAAAREAAEAQVAQAEREATAAREAAQAQVAQAKRAADERVAAAQRERDDTVAIAGSRAAEAGSGDAWVPPDKLRLLDGSARSVSTSDVFPDGCLLDSISEAEDYDEETDTGGSVVDINRPRGRMYRCAVVDLNREHKDGPHDAVVNIMADQEPSLPTGRRYPLVEFEGLTITPYVTDRSPVRLGYALRATGIKHAPGQAQQAS
jgi:hypothetical protein